MMCFDCEDYRLVHGGFHTVDEAVLNDSPFGVDEICLCANDANWVFCIDANMI